MKNLGFFFIALLCLVFFVLILPFFPLFIIYELTPARREQMCRFEMKILSILARRGETRAPELLKQTNQELEDNIGIGTFYATMRRLEEDGEVKRRRVMEEARNSKKRKKYSVSYFRITGGGRRSRVKRARTVGETLRGFGGVLKPVGARAVIKEVFFKE